LSKVKRLPKVARLFGEGISDLMRASSLRASLCLGVALLATTALSGCVAVVAGTAAGGYTLATEQRSPQQLAQDAAIGAQAHKAWSDANTDLARDVDATIYDGRVLITGIVPNADMKETAGRLVRPIQGVTEVYNEVQVGQPTNLAQDARDNLVSNTLRAKLLTDSEVRSSNFTVHTLNGIVYVIGYARNGAERDRVISYARNLSNVVRVVSYIRVGSEGQAPASTPSANESAPSNAPEESAPVAAPTPRDSIEVTPLQ
jgi:osmotically-inducible protein OsmY